jgi:D-3-phosphoglycerate dehydrogenase
MTILLLEPLHPEAHRRLAALGRVVLAEADAEAEQAARTEPVEAIITRGRGRVQRPLIEACPALKVVARVGVGLDNVDVEAATERGVMVLNAPGSTTIATAEHAMMLMIALGRQLLPAARAVQAGHWAYRRDYSGDELADKTLGIVGMGAIGQRVAHLAEAFGMRVVYWSRTEKAVPYPWRSLPHLLAEADVVSIHVALTPETRHLLGRDELAAMKPGALLINTARGAVIDQDALLAALDNGPLGGFAADVLAQEPPDAADPLLRHENVLLTPHTAALTANTFRKMNLRTIANVVAVLRDEPVEAACVVNPAYVDHLG